MYRNISSFPEYSTIANKNDKYHKFFQLIRRMQMTSLWAAQSRFYNVAASILGYKSRNCHTNNSRNQWVVPVNISAWCTKNLCEANSSKSATAIYFPKSSRVLISQPGVGWAELPAAGRQWGSGGKALNRWSNFVFSANIMFLMIILA